MYNSRQEFATCPQCSWSLGLPLCHPILKVTTHLGPWALSSYPHKYQGLCSPEALGLMWNKRVWPPPTPINLPNHGVHLIQVGIPSKPRYTSKHIYLHVWPISEHQICRVRVSFIQTIRPQTHSLQVRQVGCQVWTNSLFLHVAILDRAFPPISPCDDSHPSNPCCVHWVFPMKSM